MQPEARKYCDRVVGELVEFDGVKSVVCFGSHAMGTADDKSDIDLYVFCSPEIVASQHRGERLRGLKDADRVKIDRGNFGWDSQWSPAVDRLSLAGRQFDITYNTMDWMKTVVRAVMSSGATSIAKMKFRPYTMLGLLENSKILYDSNSELEDLRQELTPYPSSLGANLIGENWPLVDDSFSDLRDYSERNIGPSAFIFHLNRLMDALTTVIFVIAERYDPATKRTEQFIRTLKVLPNASVDMYAQVLEGPFDQQGRIDAVKRLETLIGTVWQLLKGKAEQDVELDRVLARQNCSS